MGQQFQSLEEIKMEVHATGFIVRMLRPFNWTYRSNTTGDSGSGFESEYSIYTYLHDRYVKTPHWYQTH